MKNATEFIYNSLCNKKLKNVYEVIQEGFSGIFVVLRILDNAEGEVSAGDISNLFGVSTARTAVMLNTLERKEYISKTKSNVDARKTIVAITDKGRLALSERKQKIEGLIDNFTSKLSVGEVNSFCNILKKVL